jgi:glycosyltransferase involved in cell wall biosynthesis
VRVLILIPAYNEADTLPGVVAEIRAEAPGAGILVVDDGSTDRTGEVVRSLGVRWLRLNERLGPGAAVRVGLRYARLRRFDVVVRIDGDGQHPAGLIPALLQPLYTARADIVVGSRYARGEDSPSTTPYFRRLIHRALGTVLSLLTGRPVTDPTSGLWAFGTQAIALLSDHHPSGYPEPELRLFLSRNDLRTVEVPAVMRDRPAGQTSLTPRRTSAAMARLLLHLVVVPLRATVRNRS